jgi:hypothetical protein
VRITGTAADGCGSSEGDDWVDLSSVGESELFVNGSERDRSVPWLSNCDVSASNGTAGRDEFVAGKSDI